MSDREVYSVHMTEGHFEAYKRWLASHQLMVVGPMPVEGRGFEGENHYTVSPADDHPGLMQGGGFIYQPIDSAVPVASQERHSEEVVVRLSPRLCRALERVAEDEHTSVSEVVREALSTRWGLK